MSAKFHKIWTQNTSISVRMKTVRTEFWKFSRKGSFSKKKKKLQIFRLHRSTMYVDAAYCYRPSSMICWSVCLSVSLSVCHTSEPCKNGCTDRHAFWVEDSGGPRSCHGKWQFWGVKMRPIVKYRDTLLSSVQKRLNWSRCRLGCGRGWAIRIMC